jgi:hypothetical protein
VKAGRADTAAGNRLPRDVRSSWAESGADGMMGAERSAPMQVGRMRASRRRRARTPLHVPAPLGLAAALALGSTLALSACSHPGSPASSGHKQCGTSHTAVGVPVAVQIKSGSVSCSTAMTVEKAYAQAIDEGKAPGNGGGGPVTVSGWVCEGFPTPEVLKTGDASKCTKDGAEILAILSPT